jgi:4-hydroxy-tetrahydrodipicolinate synthase
MAAGNLPHGIVPVVQTPFASDGSIDFLSLDRLVADAIAGGASGFLAPVVASEVAWLTVPERKQILERISNIARGRVPLIVGASSDDPATCRDMATFAMGLGAAAWLVAVPQFLYQRPDGVASFFLEVCRDCPLPLVIQDLQFGGPGLPLSAICELRDKIPTFTGIKVETIPSGPKYTEVRNALGRDFYIAGGWALPQMIEALDRGVDAMIPESSMVRVYRTIDQLYRSGQRDEAVQRFRLLLPVLVFTNQELAVSIAFFKRLLVRKGIFTSEALRIPGFTWDCYNVRIADELIKYYLTLESTDSR